MASACPISFSNVLFDLENTAEWEQGGNLGLLPFPRLEGVQNNGDAPCLALDYLRAGVKG